MSRLIIAGSREFTDYARLKYEMSKIVSFNVTQIVSGGARGADTLGERYAKEHGIPFVVFKADWDTHGRSAGYKRNVQMAENADRLLAFWDGESKGTKHMIDIAKSKGLKVKVIMYKDFVMMPILGFQGEYRFLSNFWICPNGVTLDGHTFRCSEAAYVAHKLDKDKYTKEQREEIYAKLATMDGRESKKYGRNIMVRPDWNKVKVEVMRRVVRAKFEQDRELAGLLRATGNARLEETNHWRDTFWGVCNGVGENWLGKILMEVRDQL